MRQGAEIMRLSSPQGTFACPICGLERPHPHVDHDISAYLNAQIHRFGRDRILEVVNHSAETFEVTEDMLDKKSFDIRDAAPDLYKALKAIMGHNDLGDVTATEERAGKVAIYKAEGIIV
jgi:hypothetical protein